MGKVYNPFSLEGKIILVTGASSGIGRETAISCSKMGASVIITARNQERLQKTFDELEGDNNRQFIADLTNQEELEFLVSQVGKLDGLVLCAGKSRSLPVLFSTREKFDEIYDVNFFSQVETLRLLVKKKCLQANSSVVILVSIAGTGRWTPGNAIYGSSKAALKSMVQYFAVELAPKRIRVNGICPGMVETPLIHLGTLTQEQLDEDREKYPLKRYGQPIDIANGAIYLLSGASSWLTGQSIVIDGGLTAK